MELLYLGTGAAEGYPALFCSCANCEAARANGGHDRRRRTSALVDDQLLIDVGPDLLAAAQDYALRLDRVRWVLQTHRHSDHLLESNFMCREADFTATTPAWWELCGSRPTIDQIATFGDPTARRLTLRTVAAFDTFALGPYTVTALRARHDMAIEPLCYVIRRDGAALLWANDTGPFFPETWEALERLGADGVRFGFAGIEATLGERPLDPGDPGGHMNLAHCAAHHQELRRRDLLTPEARCYAHHLSHEANPSHAALTALLAPSGVAPAHDGLRVEIAGGGTERR